MKLADRGPVDFLQERCPKVIQMLTRSEPRVHRNATLYSRIPLFAPDVIYTVGFPLCARRVS